MSERQGTGSEGQQGLSSGQGPATDARNDPVVDPSKNVMDLVEAREQRQDDLREMEAKHIREVLALRAEAGARDRKCGEELADLSNKHSHEMADLRAHHGEELRKAESGRIDSIRQVDVDAVQKAAEVQATQQTTLANQVAAAAEAFATRLAAALEPIQKDIQDLRKAQYEAQGQKTQVVETQAHGSNIGMWVGVGLSALFLLLAVLSIAVTLIVNGQHP